MRDDFSTGVKDTLSKRVGLRCSNPGCRKPTGGPQEDPAKAISVGAAAHITAASPDGPRFDHSFTPEQRGAAENGIWLCQTCGKLVDNDSSRYTVEVLRHWKGLAEAAALRSLENRSGREAEELLFLRLEQLMPDLLDEMRKDLSESPLVRDFIIMNKGQVYNPDRNEQLLAYFYEDHPDLYSKLWILQNHGLIHDVTFTNVHRYRYTEALARYLGA